MIRVRPEVVLPQLARWRKGHCRRDKNGRCMGGRCPSHVAHWALLLVGTILGDPMAADKARHLVAGLGPNLGGAHKGRRKATE